MAISEHWKLCTEFSIVQAAILIAGYDPEELDGHGEQTIRAHAPGYAAARTALFNAVRAGTLTPSHTDYDHEGDSFHEKKTINPYGTTISAADLNAFLKAKGRRCEFFETASERAPAEFSLENWIYPPKLGAAIKAWSAVTADPTALRGKTPKQALRKWLNEHAAELDLLNNDGKPNSTGIEEICKVANWKPEGGATPTPSPLPPPSDIEDAAFWSLEDDGPINGFKPARQNDSIIGSSAPVARLKFAADLDDEIPF